MEPFLQELNTIANKKPDVFESGLINFKKKRQMAALISETQARPHTKAMSFVFRSRCFSRRRD